MSSTQKLVFVLGTRPEAVKLAPLILAAKADSRFSVRVISTGQHTDMLKPVMDLFDIKADIELNVMRPNQDLASLNGRLCSEITASLLKEKPDWTIVQGDTITCAAASLSAFLLHLPVAHVEAGLRTHNMMAPWPEEFNRRLTALTAAAHFAPTQQARQNLIDEKIDDARVHVTGNTGIDAQLLSLDLLRKKPRLRSEVNQKLAGLEASRKLILLTVHRREAHGDPLKVILRSVLKIIENRQDVEVAFPVHKNPNVRAAVEEVLGSKPHPRIHLFEPLDYLTFLALMDRTTLILTDSGGVQEEAPTLKKPVLVLRETTERQEAVDAGCALVVGFDSDLIVSLSQKLLDSAEARNAMFAQGNPFGDGHASQRILDEIAGQSVLLKAG